MEFTALESSPRTWGCFYDYDCPYGYAGVFPTHVGVFLSRCALRKAAL